MKTRLTAVAFPLLLVAVFSTPTIEAIRGIKKHVNNDIVERQLSIETKRVVETKDLEGTLLTQLDVETAFRDKCEKKEREKIMKKLEKCESVFEKIKKKEEAGACGPFEPVIIDDSDMLKTKVTSEFELIEKLRTLELQKEMLERSELKQQTAMTTEELVLTDARRKVADAKVQDCQMIQLPDLRELLKVNEREHIVFQNIPTNVKCPVVENPGGEQKVQVCLLRSGRTHEILSGNVKFLDDQPGGWAETKTGRRRFLCGPCENYAATQVKAKRTPRGNQCDSDVPIITGCQDDSTELEKERTKEREDEIVATVLDTKNRRKD